MFILGFSRESADHVRRKARVRKSTFNVRNDSSEQIRIVFPVHTLKDSVGTALKRKMEMRANSGYFLEFFNQLRRHARRFERS